MQQQTRMKVPEYNRTHAQVSDNSKPEHRTRPQGQGMNQQSTNMGNGKMRRNNNITGQSKTETGNIQNTKPKP